MHFYCKMDHIIATTHQICKRGFHVPILCLSYEKDISEVFSCDDDTEVSCWEISSIFRRSLRIALKLFAVSCSVFTFIFPIMQEDKRVKRVSLRSHKYLASHEWAYHSSINRPQLQRLFYYHCWDKHLPIKVATSMRRLP